MEARGARRCRITPLRRTVRALGAGIPTRDAPQDATGAHAGGAQDARPALDGGACAAAGGGAPARAADQPPAARGRRGRRTRRRWAPAGTRCGRRRSGRSTAPPRDGGPGCRGGRRAVRADGPRGGSAPRCGRPSAVSVSGAGSSRSMRRRPTRRPWHGLPSRRARGCAGRRPEVSWQLSRIAIPRWRDIPTRCLLLRLPSGSMRPVLQEIRADYLDGDERHPAREGGRLRIESNGSDLLFRPARRQAPPWPDSSLRGHRGRPRRRRGHRTEVGGRRGRGLRLAGGRGPGSDQGPARHRTPHTAAGRGWSGTRLPLRGRSQQGPELDRGACSRQGDRG